MRKGMIWVCAFICGISLYTVVQFSTATTREKSPATMETGGTLGWAEPRISDQTTCTLSIEAGVIFKSGDVKPVARTEFYLSNKSFASVLRELEKSRGTEKKEDETDSSVLLGFALSVDLIHDGGLTDKGIAGFNEDVATLKKHVLASTISDFSGKATFKPLAPGTY